MKKLATLFTRSLQEFKQVKTVTVCAMLGAVALVLGMFSVQITPSVRIGFSGIPNKFVAWMFGPVVGGLFNGSMDILKFIAKPTGQAFFPGLTMVTILSGVIYGCFFYGKPLRLWRVLAAQFTVALFCNVILNTYCLSILLGKGFWVLVPGKVTQNLITWPINSLLFFYLAKFMETAGVLRPFGMKPALGKYQNHGEKR